LKAVREGELATDEISAFHARQIRGFEKEELTRELGEVWGDVRPTAAEKMALIQELKQQLTADAGTLPRPSEGRAIFAQTCATCHVLYGEGKAVGPDLTGSNRKHLDYLLENIIDPSAS